MLEGRLRATNCSNQTVEARAGRAGFEIAFDAGDCSRCGDWRLVAEPEDQSFLWSKYKVPCDSPQPLVLRCHSKSRVLRHLDSAVAAGDWGRAVLISSDLHARSGESAALQAYKDATAEFFSVSPEAAWKTDVKQGKEVATPVLVERIREYQRESGIPATGVIDFPTAARMAVEGRARASVGPAPLYERVGGM